jgi:purine-nucleoside phosphorylase
VSQKTSDDAASDEITLIERGATAVRARCTLVPKVAIVLGSGLSALADVIDAEASIAYADIPGLPPPTVQGHDGRATLGRLRGVPVIAFRGRAHLYEGHGPNDVVRSVRIARALGAETLVLTNAAGGIRADLGPGTLMALSDHLNLTHVTPLLGSVGRALGPRFPDMTTAYDEALREKLVACASTRGFALSTGVYAGLLGPSYETPAEVRMLHTLGADAVGMSTVLETIAARHLRMRVCAISVISNHAAGIGKGELDHSEVERAANEAGPRLTTLVSDLVESCA